MTLEQFGITCVIPTHDRPELLRQSIACVLNQQCRHPFDLLVVDDVGNPASKDAVTDASNGSQVPIKYVVRQGPPGVSASRNFALSHRGYELLAFLDDDDLWDERFLERAVDSMELSGADMAISWLHVMDTDGSIRPLYRLPPNLRPADAAARNVGFTGSNFVVKLSAFEALNGFDVNLQVSNDKDFFLRFLLAGFEYSVVTDFLATHRRHTAPQLTAGNERRANGVEVYLRKHEAILTRSSKRHLKNRIHRIRMRTSSTRARRVFHALQFALSVSATDIRSKWKRRDGRYSDLS